MIVDVARRTMDREMRIGICLVACLLLAVFAVPAQAHEAVTRACGQIGFTPNSDDGVFRIRAHGVGCTTARRVARAARPLGIIRGTRRYRSHGFSCRGTLDDSSLPSVRWRCTRGAAVITFVRS